MDILFSYTELCDFLGRDNRINGSVLDSVAEKSKKITSVAVSTAERSSELTELLGMQMRQVSVLKL